jgi:hypothetical protein
MPPDAILDDVPTMDELRRARPELTYEERLAEQERLAVAAFETYFARPNAPANR